MPTENAAQTAEIDSDAVEQDLVAPRISIEAFCVTECFADALQSASKDRRMAKAKSTVTTGGVDAAVKRYGNLSAPHMVIIETKEGGFKLFGELEKLAEVLAPETQVIVAGPSNDVGLYRELMRNGVSDYLVTPAAPMQIIEAIIGAYGEPDATPCARSFTVFGVRGGVGASVVAQNLACELAARAAKDTIFIDLDIEFGAASLGLNLEPKHTILDAYGDLDGLDDVKLARVLHARGKHLKILPSPGETVSRGPAAESEALTLIEVARQSCDILVLDAPSGWRACSRVALRQAAMPILVASPDLVSLRNTRNVMDWLRSERPNDPSPKVVLTQIGQPKRPEITESEFGDIIGAPIDLALAFDAAVYGAALNDGKTLRETSGGAAYAEAIAAFGDMLLGRQKPIRPASPKGLAKLFGAIGLRS